MIRATAVSNYSRHAEALYEKPGKIWLHFEKRNFSSLLLLS